MFKTYIRPLLEYKSQIWSPYLLKDIDKIENVQRSFTKRLPGMNSKSYQQRLRALHLQSLELRRIVNDLVLFQKIVHGIIGVNTGDFFEFKESNLRGHHLKVHIQTPKLDYRKYSFVNRTAEIWNLLPPLVVEKMPSKLFKVVLSELDLSVYCRGRAHTAVN